MNIRMIGALSAIVVLTIFVILFVSKLNKNKDEEDIRDVIAGMASGNDFTKNILIFQYERYLLTRLDIPRKSIKLFLYAERILLVTFAILSFIFFGVLGVGVVVCAIILVIMDNKLKDEIYRSGVTRLEDTIAFMDYFTPQVASGNSATQAFLNYVNRMDDDNPKKAVLEEYYNRKRNRDLSYEVPDSIKDIVSVYENALYNEEMGSENYIDIIQEAKEDLFQKNVYYTEYQSKTGEVLKPIELAYYIGVPAIIVLLFGSFGDFWFTLAGFITMIALIVLFFLFKFFVNKLAIDTIREIL